ncbi:MAG TPA: nicotinate phosphoribosyltransferase [Acidimicrobiia bacterium]|nr:nicotinate phosphoribosyltransferase [Acidimicrobiia bacterium]
MTAERRGDHDVRHALLVDLYELTMVDAFHREGLAEEPSTFSLYVRHLPPGRGYLVAAGLADALTWLEELHFDAADLAALERVGGFGDEFLRWLSCVRFTGDVRAVPEGTIVFEHEPILEVDAPIGQAQLAETFLLNQVTLQTTLATKASRFRHAAGDASVVDFALRRTHGIDAGMKLARCCRIVGLGGTSNVAASDRYGFPASGTMAHSFVQAHDDETDAFRTFAQYMTDRAVLVVDTYDTATGVGHAIEVARELAAHGTAIRGIRLDSGDLAALARDARARLDAAGLGNVLIFASGGLDEHAIEELRAAGAPIDGYGVGSSLGTSADAPVLDSVYKLVEFAGRPVVKTSTGKATWPGPKQVWRDARWSGDVLALRDEPAPGARWRPLLEEVMRAGIRTDAGRRDLAAVAAHFDAGWESLPEPIKHLTDPAPYPTLPSTRLVELAEELGGTS